MTEQLLSRETIDDYVLYGHEESEHYDQAASLWVVHSNGDREIEYPMISNTGGRTIFNSADPTFSDVNGTPLDDEFYEHFGVHVSRLLAGEDYAIHDFWAWLPDNLNDLYGWVLYECLVHVREAHMTFEIQELVDGKRCEQWNARTKNWEAKHPKAVERIMGSLQR